MSSLNPHQIATLLLSSLYCATALFFIGIRLPEICSLIIYSTAGLFLLIISFIAMLTLFISPSKTFGYMLRRLVLIALALSQLKQKLDHDIKINLKAKDLHDHVSIVTGANSGLGCAVSEQLVSLGSKVVLACRNDISCNNAANKIETKYPSKKDLIFTMHLDLDDLTSVKKFTDDFLRKFQRLDILVNNAGIIAKPGELTAQGLEKSFGVMHIGHFALTKWLLKLLMKPLPTTSDHNNNNNMLAYSSRVVNIASDAMLVGNFHPSFMLGSGSGDLAREITDNCGFYGSFECCPVLSCPNTNGYARAKLANVMHAYELQKRVDAFIESSSKNNRGGVSKNYRRVVSSSLHPGTVNTNIHPFLQSDFTSYFTRSSKEAAYVVLHAILDDSYIPSSYIDGMRKSHDLFEYEQSGYLKRHTTLFPHVNSMPLMLNMTTNPIREHNKYMAQYGLHPTVWKSKSLIVGHLQEINRTTTTTANAIPNINSKNSNNVLMNYKDLYTKQEVSARLWDVSEKIISDWSNRKPILKGNNIIKPTSSLKL